MAKKNQKTKATGDSDVTPRESAVESTHPARVPDVPGAEVQPEGPMLDEGAGENPVTEEHLAAPAETVAPPSLTDAESDPLDGLRRLLQEEEAEQAADQSGNWWSRSEKPARFDEASDVQRQDISSADTPEKGGLGQGGAGQGEEFREGESQSKTWWNRGVKPRYVDPVSDVPTGDWPKADPPAGDALNPMGEPGKTGEFAYRMDEKHNRNERGNPIANQDGYPPAYADGESQFSDPELEELKRRAFQHRVSGEEQADIPEIRSIVLEGGEDVFIEVETPPSATDVWAKRINAVESILRPYKRIVYAGLALLLLIMIIIAGVVSVNVYQGLMAPTPAKEEAILPYPVTLDLPGGLQFELEKGVLKDGEWNPDRPEWLEGTELCRWVAIPWSLQLEAVVQTLEPKDPITLEMSNNDLVTYKVDSVRQLSTAEMQKLDTNSPCMVLVLSGSELKTRWVVMARP